MDKKMTVNLGSVEQVPLGQGMCFVVHDEEIAVFRPREGGLLAVGNRCPHRQGPLSEGVVGGGKVVCPLHGHKFDLATGQGSEAHECVRIFKIAAENGQMMLDYPGVVK